MSNHTKTKINKNVTTSAHRGGGATADKKETSPHEHEGTVVKINSNYYFFLPAK